MRNLITKNVRRIMVAAVALLVCMIPVSAAEDCPTGETKVYKSTVYSLSGNIADKNIEELIAKAMNQINTSVKPVCPTTPTTPPTPAPTTPSTNTNNSSSVQDIERQVVVLVNKVRKQNGLSELTLNEALSNVARAKANDMANNKYFSHTSPTYGSPFDMMKQFGISYRTAGENIAMGQTTAQQVFDGWMNSEGHRANILNSSFTQIGVGFTSNGNYWSQMFIG